MSDITLPKRATLDSAMAYREAGDPSKPTALFLHGSPISGATSCRLWRRSPIASRQI
jgi:haloalkane dehalogenase